MILEKINSATSDFISTIWSKKASYLKQTWNGIATVWLTVTGMEIRDTEGERISWSAEEHGHAMSNKCSTKKINTLSFSPQNREDHGFARPRFSDISSILNCKKIGSKRMTLQGHPRMPSECQRHHNVVASERIKWWVKLRYRTCRKPLKKRWCPNHRLLPIQKCVGDAYAKIHNKVAQNMIGSGLISKPVVERLNTCRNKR